eukprot:CAMPEP_0181172872 /NCGR_PEP_ID=MMETSP1096-20121128/2683_1 /TAXON_ID=156174 ORGANISM="Chrysochromulina ericina, Strain CCMP281" /NCGR_SAMPLE_ID=MMETSP1096 /ASSEMBLY_ACC=CAM_ASM_000453 /LENGTH=162 /DNA_ID=CAMNT_0023260633 /DNA_START=70 /DNA_END=558 /DNA_ORIENTATION=+
MLLLRVAAGPRGLHVVPCARSPKILGRHHPLACCELLRRCHSERELEHSRLTPSVAAERGPSSRAAQLHRARRRPARGTEGAPATMQTLAVECNGWRGRRLQRGVVLRPYLTIRKGGRGYFSRNGYFSRTLATTVGRRGSRFPSDMVVPSNTPWMSIGHSRI